MVKLTLAIGLVMFCVLSCYQVQSDATQSDSKKHQSKKHDYHDDKTGLKKSMNVSREHRMTHEASVKLSPKTGTNVLWKIKRIQNKIQAFIFKRSESQERTNLHDQNHGKHFSWQSTDGDLRKRPTTKKRRSLTSSVDIKCTSQLLSCKDRCLNTRDPGVKTDKLRCSCDPYCDYFKDCCADHGMHCLKKTGESGKKMKYPDEEWTCRSSIWMIASCPRNWTNNNISQLCSTERRMTANNYENERNLFTHDNKTFANQFCAHCHGYTKNQIKSYELEKILPRRYCYWSENTCPASASQKLQTKCLFGNYGLVYYKSMKKTFKNVYCFTCHNVSLSGSVECGPGEGHKPHTSDGNQPKPFSAIMGIAPALSKKVTSEICSERQVYDVFLETCREAQYLVPVISYTKKYRVAMWMKAIGISSPLPIYLFKEELINSFSKAIMINSSAISSVRVAYSDGGKQLYGIEFDLDQDIYASYNSSNKELEIKINNCTLFQLMTEPKLAGCIFNTAFHSFKIIKVTSKLLTCVQADTYSLKEYQVLPGTKASVIINKTGEVLTDREYFSNNTKMVDGESIPFGNIVVCRQMLSGNCSGAFISLQRHEYDIFPNRSVFYKAAGNLYEFGTYMWKNGTVMICSTFKISYQKRDREVSSLNDTVLAILTYIGLTISILCLVYVLFTYGLFPDLRTLPGINLMNLSSALLVAQLMWLVGSGLTFAKHSCTAIAIILHYSFLASFMWMSIIAFDTWRAFAGKSCRPSRNDKRERRKRILRMMTIGWLPLIIYVSVCVALDQSGAVAIRYGGDKGCWINNSRANLYFFAIPVAISISWNAVFFVLIVKAIKKTKEQSQMVTSQHQARRDSPVYARIAALMGFTWVFGFLAPYTTQYLLYLFVILSTLQGLYIAVAFGLNERVRLLYKKFSMKKSEDRVHTSNDNTVASTRL